MNLLNPFSDATRELFEEAQGCWECGVARADALHHILKRISSSPFNAAPVHNHGCHIGRGDIHHEAMQSKYLNKTSRYLRLVGYEGTPKDLDFIREHRKLYASEEIAFWLEKTPPLSIFTGILAR